jgi:hypothetical protein
MIKTFLWIVVGVIVALQLERLLGGLRSRFSPSAVTGSMLDRVNERLERDRFGARS